MFCVLKDWTCHYCKRVGHHNRSLCPKQFIETPQSSETTATNQSSTVNKATCANQSPIVNRESSQADATTETTTDTVAPAVNTEHMLLTNGERVLLQTAIVPVYCANGSIVSARILLDSASQRTFMTEKLAKQLNLSSERKKHCQFQPLDLKVLNQLTHMLFILLLLLRKVHL